MINSPTVVSFNNVMAWGKLSSLLPQNSQRDLKIYEQQVIPTWYIMGASRAPYVIFGVSGYLVPQAPVTDNCSIPKSGPFPDGYTLV